MNVAFVGNPGHSLRALGRQESRQVHALEDCFVFSVGHTTIVPAYGRVHKLGCANKNGVYLLPEQLDEEVTTPYFIALGVHSQLFPRNMQIT